MSDEIRGPLQRASVGGIDPPAIRWVPNGDDAGFYAYSPVWRKWRRFGFHGAGEPIQLEPVRELPAGSEQLFCWADVQVMLREYHEIRRDRGLTDISDERHAEFVDEVCCLMLDASDWPMIAADMRLEQARGES